MRARTMDEETLEDWVSRIRFSTVRLKERFSRDIALDAFDSADFM